MVARDLPYPAPKPPEQAERRTEQHRSRRQWHYGERVAIAKSNFFQLTLDGIIDLRMTMTERKYSGPTGTVYVSLATRVDDIAAFSVRNFG